jgi:hypothetical protein
MASLAELTVQLDLQSAAFSRGMDQANAQLAKMEANSKKTSGGIASIADGLRNMVAGAGLAAIATMAKSLMDAADAASDTAAAFGTSIDKIYAYNQAMLESGGKADAMANGLQKLADTVDSAFEGTDAAVEAFNRLGISMASMKNQNLDTIFERVTAALAKETDEVKRNALAKDILGKSMIGVEYEKFNEQLAQSSAKYKELQPYLEAAADTSEYLAATWKSFTTYLTAASGAVAMAVGKLAQGFSDIYSLVTGKKSLAEAMALPEVAASAEKAAPAIERIAKATSAQSKAAADAVKELEKWNKEIERQVVAQIDWESKLLDSLNPMREIDRELAKLEVALQSGHISWEQYADGIFKITDSADKLKEIKDPLDEIGVAIGNTLAQGVSGLIDSFSQAGKSFGEFATSFLTSIAKMIAQTLVLKAIQSGLKGTSAGNFLGFANGGSFGGGTGLPHGVYTQPTLFKFANGGSFGSRLGVLGEKGSEAILPLKRGTNGQLGVQGGSAVNVVINNNAPVEVSQSSSQGADGQTTINIMIDKRLKDGLASGNYDKSFRSAFGISRQAA